MKDQKFDAKSFLGMETLSPLENSKIKGGQTVVREVREVREVRDCGC